MMLLVEGVAIRELAHGLRASVAVRADPQHVFGRLADLLDACAVAIERRDAEIEGLQRALDATREGGR